MEICRLDLQIDWLEFNLLKRNLSRTEQERTLNEWSVASEKSDQILISGGGFAYDYKDKKFMQAKPYLMKENHSRQVWNYDLKYT